MFLLQNYKQALRIQLEVGRELQVYESETGFGAAHFLRWHQEEMTFLSTAKRKEPDELTLKVSYVEALENFFAIRCFFFLITLFEDLIICSGSSMTPSARGSM